MHARSSERSRYQRYFAMTEWRDVQLRRLSGGHRGATLVAMSFEGEIIALGNVFPDSPGDGTAAEVALIVEDAHQGRGLGTVMLRRMIQMAERLGFTSVVAVVLADNAGMLHLLETTGLAWTTTISAGVATMRAPLGVGHARQFPEGSEAPADHPDDHPEEGS
jgi:RimJ/RimL family protein N-acetyltransferase